MQTIKTAWHVNCGPTLMELRRESGYVPLKPDGNYDVAAWPTIKTKQELAEWVVRTFRPVGPFYYKRPGYKDEVELIGWYPGDYRVLGRQYPSGEIQWIYRTAGAGVSTTVGSPVEG